MPSPAQRKQHDIRRSFWLDRPISHKYQFSLFESKREIIRVQKPETGEWEEQWTGDYIFENEWQIFRIKEGLCVSVDQHRPPMYPANADSTP